MNNSLYELIPYMSPDSLRTFLKTSNSFFDTHTKKNIGYEDINGDQYVGTTENYGSEILMESRKMLMNNHSLKNLFTKNTFDYYFDIEFCPMVDSYYQSNMMYALLSKDVLISSRRYNITFTNCEEVIVLRSESSSDPNVKKSRFICTSTPPTLNIIDHIGLAADETVSLEITDDTSNTEYYFLIDITTEDFIDNFDETTHVLKTKNINDADAGLPFVWICNDKFNSYPILEFNNNIDDSNHPLMTIGTNGHDIYGLYPYVYGTSNVPTLPDPTHEGEWYIQAKASLYNPFINTGNMSANYERQITEISFIYTKSINEPYYVKHTITITDDKYIKLTLSNDVEWSFKKPVDGDYDYDGATYINNIYAYIKLSKFIQNTQDDSSLVKAFSMFFDESYLTPYEFDCVNAVSGIHIDASSEYAERSVLKKNGIIHSLGEFDGLPKYFKTLLDRTIHHSHVELYAIRDKSNTKHQSPMKKQTSALIIDSAVPKNDVNYIIDDLNICIRYNQNIGRLFYTSEESVSTFNQLSEIVYVNDDNFSVCTIPKYSMNKKFVYHGNRSFSLGKIGFDPETEISRVYIISNDPPSYENNTISDNKKSPRAFARICDIPTYFLQLTHIKNESPTIIIDKEYVHQEAPFTEADKLRIWNGDEDGRCVTKLVPYGSCTRRIYVFPADEDLNVSINRDYLLTYYKSYVRFNQSFDLNNNELYTFTINSAGTGYSINDKFNLQIGGMCLLGSIMANIGGVVTEIHIDTNEGDIVNIGNLKGQITTFETTPVTGSGKGLKINLEIVNSAWNWIKPMWVGRFSDLYAYKMDKFNNLYVYNYDDDKSTWVKGYQITGTKIVDNYYDDFNTQQSRSLHDVCINNLLNKYYSIDKFLWEYPLSYLHRTLLCDISVSAVPNSVDLSTGVDLSSYIINNNKQDCVYVINNKAEEVGNHSLIRFEMFPQDIKSKMVLPRFNQLNLSYYYNKACCLSCIFTDDEQPSMYVYNPTKDVNSRYVYTFTDVYKKDFEKPMTFVDVMQPTSAAETQNIFDEDTGVLNRNVYQYNEYEYCDDMKSLFDTLSVLPRISLINYIKTNYGKDVEPLMYEGSSFEYTKEMLIDYIKQNTYINPMYKKNNVNLLRRKGDVIFSHVNGEIVPEGKQPTGGYNNLAAYVYNKYAQLNDTDIEEYPFMIFKIPYGTKITNLNKFVIEDTRYVDISDKCLLIYNNKVYVHAHTRWVNIREQ